MSGSRDIAVALGYDSGLPAPVVLAGGRGGLARAIRQTAERLGIPLVSDGVLADELIEITPGSFIPERYYRIIAEILVFVGGVARQDVAPDGAGERSGIEGR